MQVIFFVFVFAFFGGAFAAPREASWYDSSSSYSESDDVYPFGYTGAYAGAGAGAAVAAGGWPYSYGFINPFFPFSWPIFRPTSLTPWYKGGENVCKEEKIVEDPDDVQEWFKDDGWRTGVSERCQERNNVVTCSKREMTDTGSRTRFLKYFCCPRTTRNPGGPGCVKKPSDDAATATEAPTTPVKSENHRSAGDRFSYVFSSSNRDATRGSDVEKVPPQ